jgi:GAF domain-containing protein/HAMP domain-containing protein
MKITVQLTIAIFLISLLSLGTVGVIAYYEAQEALTQQITNQLESVATIQKSRIQAIIEQNLERLNLVASRTQLRLMIQRFNRGPSAEGRQEMNENLTDLRNSISDFKNVSILNQEGEVIASTVPAKIGETHPGEEYFTRGLAGKTADILFFDEQGELSLYLTGPLYEQGELLGVVVVESKADRLVGVVNDYTGLGETGETVFAKRDTNGDALFLTPLRFDPNAALTRRVAKDDLEVPITQALLKKEIFLDGTSDYLNVPVLAVTRYIPQTDWGMASKIYKEEALRPVVDLRNFLIAGTVGISLAVALIAVLIARTITNPIISLTQTAQKISAGDISQRAAVRSSNEIGTLAQAFNQMTTQLQETLGTLEEQVAARTRRLEIAASLGERFAGILDFDQLLTQLVEQVKASFGYYHAHIYILDDERENLVMTAGAGEPGAKMKATGHHIPLRAPASLVARAARSGQIVRVDNVREAKDWLPNPLLPDTYSEMSVPIIVDEQVMGVLDVQQNRIAGLDEGDANLLRSLANQVAVSIRNARLFAEVESALAEAHIAQEIYQQQAWEAIKRAGQERDYLYSRPGSPVITQEQLLQLDHPPHSSARPAVLENALMVPIRSREQSIGVIQLLDIGPARQWDERELALIESVGDQVAQVAENLRLLYETQERASRERLVAQISDKMRRATDMETLLQTAVTELTQALGSSRTFAQIGTEAPLPQKELS